MESLVEYKEMREAIARVRKLHKPATFSEGSIHIRYCSAYCEPTYYPCDTIKALDGEQ